jgi:hypothetical protein
VHHLQYVITRNLDFTTVSVVLALAALAIMVRIARG